MNPFNNPRKIYLRPMVRSAETLRRFYLSKRRTPKGRYFF